MQPYSLTLKIPNFEYTGYVSKLCQSIEIRLNKCREIKNISVRTKLRRISHLTSINSSLSIEANSLSLTSMKDVINGKTVIGPFDEIQEVKNADSAYSMLKSIDPLSIEDFLRVEEAMMFGLVEQNGFRSGSVGVFEGERCIYKAPEAGHVVPMMESLFTWVANSGYPGYILGSIFHYYTEIIHPFNDGNGRMGRLWHTALMRMYDKSFDLISMENLIHSHQEEYYRILGTNQDDWNCTEFVVFCLKLIDEELELVSKLENPNTSRIIAAMGDEYMTASEIMRKLNLSNRSYFLKNFVRPAVEMGLIEMYDPERPRSRNQKYRSRFGLRL